MRESLRDELAGPLRGEFGKPAKQKDLRKLMRIVAELGIEVNDSIASALVSVAESFKAPEAMRSQAIRTYMRAAPLSVKTIETVVAWLGRRGRPYETAVPGSAFEVLRRARQRIESARAVYPALNQIENALIEEWGRVRPERARYIDDFSFRGLRSALRELHDMRMAFGELSA